jgi:hypothetical protein
VFITLAGLLSIVTLALLWLAGILSTLPELALSVSLLVFLGGI